MTTFIKIAQLGTNAADAALKERGWEDSRDFLECAEGTLVTDKCYIEIANDDDETTFKEVADDILPLTTVKVANNIAQTYWADDIAAYEIDGAEGLWIDSDEYTERFL